MTTARMLFLAEDTLVEVMNSQELPRPVVVRNWRRMATAAMARVPPPEILYLNARRE